MHVSIASLAARIKRHPLVMWALSIVPIVGMSFGIMNAWYSKTIAEYRVKADHAAATIQALETKLAIAQRVEAEPAASSSQSPGGQRESRLGEPLSLKRGQPVFLFGGNWRIVLDHTYMSMRSVNATAYIGRERKSLDLYADQRYSVTWAGDEYYIDLLSVESDTATLRITKRGA